MGKMLFVAAILTTAVAAAAVLSPAQAQRSYGPGGYGCCGYGMMGGYGPGYYGHGHMMGWGYAQDTQPYRAYRDYRGRRLCWTESARGYGYYAPCRR
jgi:opacity protein-like surface antigen